MTKESIRPDRRDFLLVGTAAGLAASTGLAVAGVARAEAEADAYLINLAAEYEHAEALFEEAATKQDRASMAAHRHYPERPECLVTPARVNPTMIEAAIREEYDVYLIEKEDNEDLKAQVDALDRYKAECVAVDARFGIPELEEKRDQLCGRTCEIETQMAETPARSMAGIAAKLKVWMINQAPDELIGSAAQDAQRLSGVVS